MSLRDIFKKQEAREKKEKLEKKRDELKPSVEKKIVKKRRTSQLAAQVLLFPQITEKAFDLSEKNQYTFRVFPRANKPQVKKAIEELYGVNVLGVRMIKIPRKRKRLGKTRGWKKGYKKTIVKIKEGQKIALRNL